MNFSSFFKIIFIISGFSFSFVLGQYLYPVAALQSDCLFVIHQKNNKELELWMLDPIKNTKIKALSSQFIPAGFKLLPSQKAFSFIDQGRIRVKNFERRSPKALDVYEPIYNFGFPHWIDDIQCVVSAQKGRRSGLFLLDTYGDVKTILYSKKSDALYPQKVGDRLFYVERTQEGSKIISVAYPKNTRTKAFDPDDVDSILAAQEAWKIPLVTNKEKNVLYTQHKKKIIFLKVQNKNELFFVEYDGNLGGEQDIVKFSYCYASQKEGWSKRDRFDFYLPIVLLFHSSSLSLYESILPLLPYHYKKKIYYSDWVSRSDGNGLDLFCYDLQNETITSEVSGKGNQNLFSPIIFQEKLFFGTSCDENFPLNIFS